MKDKLLSITLLGLLIVFASGCATNVANLTPPRVPQNPSGIYTLSMTFDPVDANVYRDSIRAFVVIDGESRMMTPSDAGERIFEYDYTMPAGRNQARFYYVITYDVNVNGQRRSREVTSGLQNLSLTNHYVITMEVTRGPVGSSIAVVGRGFTRSDVVVVGGVESQTTVNSANALTFVVPPLPARQSYQAELLTGFGSLPMGNFFVDIASINVAPEALTLDSGEATLLVFAIDNRAPEGGLALQITTDIPDSVIMAPVVIPAGERSVSVRVEGGSPGRGQLFVSAPGFSEVQVPVRVN
jgi:hypothetical protein